MKSKKGEGSKNINTLTFSSFQTDFGAEWWGRAGVCVEENKNKLTNLLDSSLYLTE